MIRLPPRSTLDRSSAASDVYKRQEYLLGEIETDLGKENFGEVKYAIGTGIVHNYARNYLNVNVANIGHKGSYLSLIHISEPTRPY